MATNGQQAEQVRSKVLYSEVDVPFNGYLDVVTKVTKLTSHILNGQLQEFEDENKIEFNEAYIEELKESCEVKCLDLQNSLDVKKVSVENWEQSNNETIERMETKLNSTIPKLEDTYEELQERISRVRMIYESVNKVNTEMEVLLEANTSLTTTRSEWESVLGTNLADRLIKQKYLKKVGKSFNGEEEKFRVYDNFTKGPKELKHINRSIKADIDRLSQELNVYKDKWLKDAEIFTNMTSLLRDELTKRDMNVDVDMDEEEDQDDDQEPINYDAQNVIEMDHVDNENENLIEPEEEEEDGQEAVADNEVLIMDDNDVTDMDTNKVVDEGKDVSPISNEGEQLSQNL